MKSRRSFLQLTASTVLLGTSGLRAASLPALPDAATANPADRADWHRIAIRLAVPVLAAAAHRRLKAELPVEAAPGVTDRHEYTHLEAIARLLAGLAPWLELGGDATPEGSDRARLGELARAAIESITDPGSPDFLNYHRGRQPLVDSAFLAQALLRAPGELWRKLGARTQQNVVAALQSSRSITAPENNWKLFATLIEAFLQQTGVSRDEARLAEGLARYAHWYLGDGVYGDGPEFHWDYYNSFVIQPMLHESLEVVGEEKDEWRKLRTLAAGRLARYAGIQERLVAPDGSYPAVGRSITYRSGAFHALAFAAWRHLLPPGLPPAQARAALSGVIHRTLDAPGTFDGNGWLRIGLSGHQPGLGENYISTGSLYLCSLALLPLGLLPSDAFWSTPVTPTSWGKAWSGDDLPADHALKESE
ncbi:MAG: DUF2264 domain-containing protein [Opitutales bacterium]